MKITWINAGAAVVAGALLAGAYRHSPTMRAAVTVLGREFLGWTTEPRRNEAASVIEPLERTRYAATNVEFDTTLPDDAAISKPQSVERQSIQQQSVQQETGQQQSLERQSVEQQSVQQN
jgi:hypothetical protein